jgi:hypothetical protein
MRPMTARRGGIRAGLAAAALLALSAAPSRADVAFVVDRSTLNDVLASSTLNEVEVPVAPGRSVTVRLEDLKVTGLDPTAGEDGRGYILSSMRLEVPEVGIDMTVRPRISLRVAEIEGQSLLELRFEQVAFPLPLVGTVNVARLLPPLHYPTETVLYLAGARGNVPVTSRLKDVEMGRQAIRFVFEVEVQAPRGR